MRGRPGRGTLVSWQIPLAPGRWWSRELCGRMGPRPRRCGAVAGRPDRAAVRADRARGRAGRGCGPHRTGRGRRQPLGPYRPRQTNHSKEITVNPSALPAHVETPNEAVDQLIARVLDRAHRTAEAVDEPNQARAILRVAQSFADELATADPRFDRLQFIKDATEDPS